MKKNCCKEMDLFTKPNCNIHDNSFECPDCLIFFNDRSSAYGIIIHDGGESFIKINFCPWCGKKLNNKKSK
jgi:uncharacterized C2H2 Zn-finger protein